jgi:sterol desaturase/sphingolipid hydroxylase (fatty acid hydroxylase superfamily)
MAFFAALFPYSQAIALFGLLTLLASFVLFAVLELLWPARVGAAGREGRMAVNFGLGFANMAVSAILPISSLSVATLAVSKGWGLFQMWPVNMFVAIALLLLAKSLLGYVIHWLFHNVEWLWPLHAVHHRDDAIDLSTSFRSHPLNHILVLLPNALLVLALGPEIWVVLITEAIMLFAVLFQHANLRLSNKTSELIERGFVSPRMHLVHHARDRENHDSNYGEFFSFWDHLFGTYRALPQETFAIGVEIGPKSA